MKPRLRWVFKLVALFLCINVHSVSSLLMAQQIFHPPQLRIGALEPNGWRHVRGDGGTNSQVITLSASSNLVDWETIAILHGPDFDFIDPGSTERASRFYRYATTQYPWEDTNGVVHHPPPLKNQVLYPLDNFLNGDSGEDLGEQWIKFLIDLERPMRVFYNGNSLFHYDFATGFLEPFVGISAAEFEQISMFNQGRRLLSGTVLYPPYLPGEYGIQFVGTDPLPRELVSHFFELVKSTVMAPPGTQPFYIPTYDQYTSAEADRNYFASNGIPISTVERWAVGDISYSAGWALGRLKFFPVANIAAAYASGELLPHDILITDGVPSELPYVPGIITLSPATANSHVAILARSYGVPFVYFIDEADRARAMQLTNREVILQSVLNRYSVSKPLLVELDPAAAPSIRDEILSLRFPTPLNIVSTDRYGAYWTNAESLVPEDIRYFGGKAANYGLLRRTIPSNAPVAIAISFDLWNEFLEQGISGETSLRQEISNRLSGFTYPPDVGALQVELAAIRSLILSGGFTTNQQSAITNALSVFDRQRKIRFRSSTNVEDAESFSGAGLYDSFSGCLADEQDGDSVGPSACDSTQATERGVFLAIRRVFASFYNDNAYLERLRVGLDERDVGMALLVHHSTPDEIEMANGVSTLTWQEENPRYEGTLVSQLGAVSVANPDGTALPEEITFTHHDPWQRIDLRQVRYSTLLPYGVRVMDWRTNYETLANLVMQVSDGYAAMFTNKSRFVLDLEYKKVSPGHLEIKQVREVPERPGTNIPPYLLNVPATFVNFQGLYGGLWATHRLKSRWTIQTRNMLLTESNLAVGLFTYVTVEHLNGTNVQITSGQLSSFSNATHAYVENYSSDRFVLPTGDGPADFELRVYDHNPFSAEHPFVKQVRPYLEVMYHNPTAVLDADFGDETPTIRVVTNASTRLVPILTESPRDTFREYTFKVSGQTNVFIRTSFWLGSYREHGDRPPVIRFVETRIEGLTTEPLRLTNYWSQTFHATHHGGTMSFLFEPRLEETLLPSQHSELAAADIAIIYLHANGYKDYRGEDHPERHGCYVLKIVGRNGAIRDFSDCGFEDSPIFP